MIDEMKTYIVHLSNVNEKVKVDIEMKCYFLLARVRKIFSRKCQILQTTFYIHSLAYISKEIQ